MLDPQLITTQNLPPKATFSRVSDCDGGEALDIGDPIYMLRYTFAGADKPACEAACDADDDGKVALDDALLALNYLFQNGPPPAPPFPEAGEDPSEDLDCGA